jgi:hypothetical protein
VVAITGGVIAADNEEIEQVDRDSIGIDEEFVR